MPGSRTLPDDWHPGTLPDNVIYDPSADLGSSYSFVRCRSQLKVAVKIERAAMLYGCTLDVGPRGYVRIGEHAMVTSALIQCDANVDIGSYAMIAWGVVIMDSYRTGAGDQYAAARPVRLGENCWIGFEACVLPGVSVGRGAIVGARAVVTQDVPPDSLVAGNPARVIRTGLSR
jgi:acetyltransferase-like isoleucine patch superfamily enzyme